MLMKHVRVNGRPIATIVAVDRDRIGIAICNTDLDSFNKDRGRNIAEGRARTYRHAPHFYVIKLRMSKDGSDDKVRTLWDEVERMKDRAKRYFKVEELVEA